jgi:acetyl-CoA carboxylase alpha subunit
MLELFAEILFRTTWRQRGFKDDKAMIGGLGKLTDNMIVGQKKDTILKRGSIETLDG